MRHPLVLLLLLPFTACTTEPPSQRTNVPRIDGPASTVTRSEVIEIARSYASTRWHATNANRFHGKDPAGIQVHTPDAETKTGFWKSTEINYGMPYKWGGFDTPRSFARGVAKGKFAGDISSSYKRRHLEAAVSGHAVGIDCSGLVSRAWRLPRSYSTRELPDLCDPLDSYEDLQPGDILNRFNRHVLIFSKWSDDGKRLYCYEAGPSGGWRATESTIEIAYLKERSFKPFRYRGIRD